MRRVIAGISNFSDVGDISTLANPEVVDDIRGYVQRLKTERNEVPRELSPEELQEIRSFGSVE